MEVGQLGRTGKIVTLRAGPPALVQWFVSVTATSLHPRTMAETVEKTTVNIEHVQSIVVVRIFCRLKACIGLQASSNILMTVTVRKSNICNVKPN